MYIFSDHEAKAVRRFYALLPRTEDSELLILKVHLLLEEQVRAIIDERVASPSSVKSADLTCYQAICIAEAFFSKSSDMDVWDALKKLNKLRNNVAHKLEPKGMVDQMSNIVDLLNPRFTVLVSPECGQSFSLNERFSFSCSMLMTRVASLVKPPPKRIEHNSANDASAP